MSVVASGVIGEYFSQLAHDRGEAAAFVLADQSIVTYADLASIGGDWPTTIPTLEGSRDAAIRSLLSALRSGYPVAASNYSHMLRDEWTGAGTMCHPLSVGVAFPTSGSTSAPKSVGLLVEGLWHFMTSAWQHYGIRQTDRIAISAAPASDFFLEQVLLTLGSTATGIVLPDEVSPDSGHFWEWIDTQEITVLGLPTYWWRQALTQMPGQNAGRSSVTKLIIGGERLRKDDIPVGPYLMDASIVNAYGPTEATIVATAGAIRAEAPTLADPSIGQPLPGVVAFVVGEDMEIVARGEVGELLLGGPGLARGYLGDPRRTAERFMPDYLSGESGARLYRTGDLMRWGDDEQLQFLGRVDDQVKIRGYRVEPGEVELALLEDPAVAQAVVVASVTPAGDPCLVAYLLDDAGAVAGVRSRLADRVPSWMVPALFMQVAQFPRTPTGKVAKTELPRPDWARSDASVDDLPTTDAERALASLWSEVLGIDDIRLSDNFFDLGGHSLNGVQLSIRVQSSLRVRMTLADVFRFPLLGAMSAELRDRGDNLVVSLSLGPGDDR
jgi:acyl-CoA synthetase (AMP-forming)/AMP-acid ligase II